jgi:hypothetical protein
MDIIILNSYHINKLTYTSTSYTHSHSHIYTFTFTFTHIHIHIHTHPYHQYINKFYLIAHTYKVNKQLEYHMDIGVSLEDFEYV